MERDLAKSQTVQLDFYFIKITQNSMQAKKYDKRFYISKPVWVLAARGREQMARKL